MKNSWLRIFSPCIIAALLSLIPIIMGFANRNHSEGWSMILVIIFLPALIALLILSAIIKALLKQRVVYIWLAEIIVVIATIVVIRSYFF